MKAALTIKTKDTSGHAGAGLWKSACHLLGALLICVFTLNPQASALQDEKPATVKGALAEIREGRVNQGVAMLLTLASDGDAEAFFHLGQIYALGAGRKRSPSVAAMYFRLAGQLGHQRAELSLANMLYFEGQSEAEIDEARQIYRRYALAGEPEALYVLGLMLWNGELGEEDPIRGYALVWRASEEGYEPAAVAELEMNSLLNLEARRHARQYALNLEEEGLGTGILAPHLLDSELAEEVGTGSAEISELESLDEWEAVWRVEVGASTSQEDAEKLLRVMSRTMGADMEGLQYRIVQLESQQGRFKILFGPLETFQDAVFQCVKFKARGYDCFSRAPK